MIQKIRPLAMAIVALAAAPASLGMTGGPSVFESMTVEYETVRQALLHDTLEGVAGAAAELHRLARAEADDHAELNKLLPLIVKAAERLGDAASLEGARDAFGDLSKSMVRYRQRNVDPEPVVVFCSMAQQVWLQPAGEIGNPYYGQSMARCGEVVSE